VTIIRAPLCEQVKEVLLERILHGTYLPGDRLVETAIARELGTSQAPVREALRDLETLRLVELTPYRGARVRATTPEELAEIYPVRAAIEEVAAREAAVRLGGDVTALEAELDAMRDAADDGDFHRQVHHDAEFHRRIIEASGNRTLVEVWTSLNIEARTLVTLLSTGINPHELVELHRPIVDALRACDPAGSGTAARRHLEQFGELFVKGEAQ
jgi:DNA-binding GntR family transcriptional regulator